ncbi:MAG TPA: hypothetical protein VLS96_09975 [Nodosilinea sp.]|nr:hypothetical protein [Nodosilinea sp.]
MTHGALQLLQGVLELLKLIDLLTSPLGLGVSLWLWLYLTLPYDQALALWLMALVPLVALRQTEPQD